MQEMIDIIDYLLAQLCSEEGTGPEGYTATSCLIKQVYGLEAKRRFVRSIEATDNCFYYTGVRENLWDEII